MKERQKIYFDGLDQYYVGPTELHDLFYETLERQDQGENVRMPDAFRLIPSPTAISFRDAEVSQ